MNFFSHKVGVPSGKHSPLSVRGSCCDFVTSPELLMQKNTMATLMHALAVCARAAVHADAHMYAVSSFIISA